MINGVIFDMDGLMFDTERMWATFWEPALAALGLEYKEGLAEAERGTAGETSRNIVRQFYGEDCDANAIIDSLHRVADEEFQKPVPKKPGLDELLAWLDANHIPMAVASSSRVHVIEGNLNNWGLTHYFKALVSGQQVKHSKPDPEIFLLAAEKLFAQRGYHAVTIRQIAEEAGVPLALVLEDSYNGVRAGAAGGFVTVMVPDLLPADDEMRGLYTMECTSLNEVLDKLKTGEL
jgi:beta-phosphoglucomutase-like phosphatase (HAD superfamily)